MKYIFSMFIVLAGCAFDESGGQSIVDKNGEIKKEDVLNAIVTIDSDFSQYHTNNIVDGFLEWGKSSRWYFNPNLIIDDVTPNQTFVVAHVPNKHPAHLKIAKKLNKEPNNIPAWVEFYHTDTGKLAPTINLVTDLIDSKNIDMKVAVIHELGHYLGLGHNESPSSVMYLNSNHSCIPKIDVINMCNVQGCSIESINPTCE